MAGLVARLGGVRRRPTLPSSSSNRRGRQRATRRPALESARLRKQRHRGLLRRRAPRWLRVAFYGVAVLFAVTFFVGEVGRANVCNSIPPIFPIPSFALKKKQN